MGLQVVSDTLKETVLNLFFQINALCGATTQKKLVKVNKQDAAGDV